MDGLRNLFVGRTEFTGKLSTTVSNAFKWTQKSPDKSNIHYQACTQYIAQEEGKEQSHNSKRSYFLKEFGIIHLVS